METKSKELFHQVENDDIILSCYYMADEPVNLDHEVVCQNKHTGNSDSVFANSRQACIALCVEVMDTLNPNQS